jgi:hypothetical protein
MMRLRFLIALYIPVNRNPFHFDFTKFHCCPFQLHDEPIWFAISTTIVRKSTDAVLPGLLLRLFGCAGIDVCCVFRHFPRARLLVTGGRFPRASLLSLRMVGRALGSSD